MTSKEKYEQTLDNLVKFLTPIHCIDTKRQKPIEEMLSTFRKMLDEYNELTHQPTLSECIKGWNEKGFDVDVYAVEIVIYKPSSVDKEEDEIEISIRIDNKIISYVNDVELSFDLHNLIHKTLKALEEIKDE